MDQKAFLYRDHVRNDWVDYNGHMNDAAYAQVFSLALDEWINAIGLDADSREHYAYTIFTLETHLCYLQEAHQDEKLDVSIQLLDKDEKRLHVIFYMKSEAGNLIATSEQMLMGMDTTTNRPGPFPYEVTVTIDEIYETDKQLDTPKQAGKRIGIKR